MIICLILHSNSDRENMKAESILCRKHGNRTQDLWLTMPMIGTTEYT